MTYRTDLPRRASITCAQKTKESKTEDSLQAPGYTLPFFPRDLMGLSGLVSLPGGGVESVNAPPTSLSQAPTVSWRSSLRTKLLSVHCSRFLFQGPTSPLVLEGCGGGRRRSRKG